LSDKVELLKILYRGFNSRDIDAILCAMHQNVVWANGMEGGHVRGRDAVRSYWTRQWTLINSRVEPIHFTTSSSGAVIVEVHQIISDLRGNLLADQMVGHIFEFEGGLINRFDIRSLSQHQNNFSA
jgi:hypothetical protein